MATPSSGQTGTPSAPTINPGKSEYDVNEKVLCFHGPLIYEAKVLKTLFMEEPSTVTGVAGWHYFVHYKGWKQTYVDSFN
jgi:mortality factor 4-like protein 1